MRAIGVSEYGDPDVLTLGSYPIPEPEPNEILVKVWATACNRADTLQRQGKYPAPPGASPILGLEMAGEVVASGSKSNKWKLGDRVCGLLSGGGHAQYVTIHEDLALPIPEAMSYKEAAAIPEVFLTAYQALFWLGELKPGEQVLVHAGASGVGTAAIQLANLLGTEVYVTASAPKHALCLELGASLAIDYRQDDFVQVLSSRSREGGPDLILDFVAAPYFQANLELLGLDGRLVMLALLGGGKLTQANLAPILRKRLRIMGSTLRNRTLTYKKELTQAFWEFAWPYFQNGKLKPVIHQTLAWTDIAEAHRTIEANQNAGKIILSVSHN
ncbi:MAG: NAD(P)H-quinone oxidoreductase [Bacteroidota bacterium]